MLAVSWLPFTYIQATNTGSLLNLTSTPYIANYIDPGYD